MAEKKMLVCLSYEATIKILTALWEAEKSFLEVGMKAEAEDYRTTRHGLIKRGRAGGLTLKGAYAKDYR